MVAKAQAGPLYSTPYGVGELVGRSHNCLEISLLWGGIIYVPVVSGKLFKFCTQ